MRKRADTDDASPRLPSLRTLPLALAGGLLFLLAGLVWASSLRVPAGSIAAVGGRLLEAGHYFKSPLAPARLIPLEGRLDGVSLRRRTSEGAAITIRLSLAYALRLEALAPHAAELSGRAGSLGAVAARLAEAAVEPLPLAVLLPIQSQAGSGGVTNLPPPATAAIARALRAAGIEPSGLTAKIGPAGAFAPPGTASAPGVETIGGPTGVKLLLIGLDGADWDIVVPLLRAGRLPNLARLVAAGSRAPLRSYDPMISPLLWTTVATGFGPDRHGVADFTAISARTGKRVPISSRFRRVKALWNVLGEAGRSTAFVAWWASYPAEQVSSGYQVSNLVVFQTLRPRPAGAPVPPGITFPPGYFSDLLPLTRTAVDLPFEEVRRVLHISRAEYEEGLRDVLTPPAPDDDSGEGKKVQKPVPLAISILTGTRNYAAIAADLAGRHPDMTAVYFEGIDMMGHRFQHCMPPRMAICPEADFDRFKDAVTGFYIEQDEAIGRILAAVGPDVLTMVISDHGFRTGDDRPDSMPFTTEQPVEWHDEEGIFILSGPQSRRDTTLAARPTLFDIAPTILYLMGLPAPEDMPGRILFEAIDPAFTAAHPARSIPSYETGTFRPAIAAAEEAGAEEAEAELLANLRALGYIGGDAGSPRAGGATASVGPPNAAPPSPGAPAAETSSPRSGPGEPRAGAADLGADTQVFYHRNLATYFLKDQDYLKAAEQLQLANQRQKLPKNYQMLSEAYLGLGRTAEAIATLEEGLRDIKEMDPETVLWIVRLQLGGAGGRSAAQETARRFAARTATRPGLDDTIAALIAEDAGDAGRAVDLFRRALAADPTRVVAAERLYALLPERERDDLLGPILERALRADRRLDESWNLLGIIRAGQGRHAEALDCFRRAAALDPSNPRFAANLAAACARNGRWAEAAAAYETAAALAPAAATYMKLGSAYRQLQRPSEALAAFERARALGDASSAPLLGMALARAEMSQVDQALGILQEGLGRFPDDRALRSLYDDLIRKTRGPGSLPGPPGRGR